MKYDRVRYFKRGPDARKPKVRPAPDDDELMRRRFVKHPTPLAPEDRAQLSRLAPKVTAMQLEALQVRQAEHARQKRLRNGRGAESDFLRKFRGPLRGCVR